MNNSNGFAGGLASVFKVFNTLILVAMSGLALAGEVNIRAEFTPDASNPGVNTFVNKTLCTHVFCYCLVNKDYCAANSLYSVVLAQNRGEGNGEISANHSDERQGVMIKIPTGVRTLSVVSASGVEAKLEVEMVGFGATLVTTDTVREILGRPGTHDELWSGGDFDKAPSNCTATPHQGSGNAFFRFFWLFKGGVCAKQALYNLTVATFHGQQVMYRLKTPNPFELESGEYVGVLSYMIGPGQDFDFGDKIVEDDSVLNVNFRLVVNHAFKVQLPPGADRLSLIPDGGWQQWLHRGRRPEKLFANQPFQISSSAKFKMQLQCQYLVGEQCGIRNESGHEVPVETRVTLPAGINSLSGIAVNRQLLSAANATYFFPSQYVDSGRALLHFEVGRDSVTEMTGYAGSRYSGNVIVVWDSQVDG